MDGRTESIVHKLDSTSGKEDWNKKMLLKALLSSLIIKGDHASLSASRDASRDRVKQLQAQLQHCFGQVPSNRKLKLAFWKDIRDKHGLTLQDTALLQKSLFYQTKTKTSRRVQRCVLGENRNGKPIRKFHNNFLPVALHSPLSLEDGTAQQELLDGRMPYIPLFQIGTVSENGLTNLKRVEKQLILIIGGGGYALDAPESSRGVPLGKTVSKGVSARRVDRQQAGRSKRKQGPREIPLWGAGRVHIKIDKTQHMRRPSSCFQQTKQKQINNSNTDSGTDSDDLHISGKTILSRNITPELQEEVINVVVDVIKDAFGSRPWFKAAVKQLAKVPLECQLPGRGSEIPCTDIWWTRDPQKLHAHVERDTVETAFVFCTETVAGGELLRLDELTGKPVAVHLKAGVVAGGSWARFPHCNGPGMGNKRRRIFVVYLQNKILQSK